MPHPNASASAQAEPAAERLPRYREIANLLREEIAAGIFPVGSFLPTEDGLCARFSVGRHTVREAIRQLREENLVKSRQGAGTMVAAPTSKPLFYDAQSFDDLNAYAADTRIVISAMKVVTISAESAAATGLPEESTWLKVDSTRVRGDDPLPECQADFYINAKYAAVGRLLHKNTGSLYTLVEDMFALQVTEMRQEISASALTGQQARVLGARKGAAALSIRREYLTAAGETVQVSLSAYPASRFRHYTTMRLSR